MELGENFCPLLVKATAITLRHNATKLNFAGTTLGRVVMFARSCLGSHRSRYHTVVLLMKFGSN